MVLNFHDSAPISVFTFFLFRKIPHHGSVQDVFSSIFCTWPNFNHFRWLHHFWIYIRFVSTDCFLVFHISSYVQHDHQNACVLAFIKARKRKSDQYVMEVPADVSQEQTTKSTYDNPLFDVTSIDKIWSWISWRNGKELNVCKLAYSLRVYLMDACILQTK